MGTLFANTVFWFEWTVLMSFGGGGGSQYRQTKHQDATNRATPVFSGPQELQRVCTFESTESLNRLLYRGLNLNQSLNKDGQTALHIVSMRGVADSVKLLLDHGCTTKAVSVIFCSGEKRFKRQRGLFD